MQNIKPKACYISIYPNFLIQIQLCNTDTKTVYVRQNNYDKT